MALSPSDCRLSTSLRTATFPPLQVAFTEYARLIRDHHLNGLGYSMIAQSRFSAPRACSAPHKANLAFSRKAMLYFNSRRKNTAKGTRPMEVHSLMSKRALPVRDRLNPVPIPTQRPPVPRG